MQSSGSSGGIAPDRDLSTVEEIKLMFLPFKSQRWYHQLLILSGGFGLWLAAFAATFTATGDWHLISADSSAGLTSRQRAAVIAGFVSTSYYIVFLFRAYGGLFLSGVWYPLLTYILMAWSVPRIFGAPQPAFSAGTVPSRFTGYAEFPVIFGSMLPVFVVGSIVLLYAKRSYDDPEKAIASFVKHWPDRQIRALFPVSPDAHPELKRTVRAAHRRSADNDQSNEDSSGGS